MVGNHTQMRIRRGNVQSSEVGNVATDCNVCAAAGIEIGWKNGKPVEHNKLREKAFDSSMHMTVALFNDVALQCSENLGFQKQLF